MTESDPLRRNGLLSPDHDEMLAAYLTLVENHCLYLVPVPVSDSVPNIPGDIGNRAVYNSWAGEYVVDYEAWEINLDENLDANQKLPFLILFVNIHPLLYYNSDENLPMPRGRSRSDKERQGR